MDNEQFTFTGLNWVTPKRFKLINEARTILNQYGIKSEFRHKIENGAQLIISDYDAVLESPNCDAWVTFLKKVCIDFPVDSGLVAEDALLVCTIDDDMQFVIKLVLFDGTIEVKLDQTK